LKNSDNRFKLNDKLNELDKEEQTFGCRHSNPDICGNCYVENVCAFTSKDNICKRPPASWRRRFLAEKNEDKQKRNQESNGNS